MQKHPHPSQVWHSLLHNCFKLACILYPQQNKTTKKKDRYHCSKLDHLLCAYPYQCILMSPGGQGARTSRWINEIMKHKLYTVIPYNRFNYLIPFRHSYKIHQITTFFKIKTSCKDCCWCFMSGQECISGQAIHFNDLRWFAIYVFWVT